MSTLDPTKFRVESHTAPIWEQEQSFQEIMADQIRHAPWIGLSILLHGILIFLLYALISGEPIEQEEQVIQLQQQETPPPIEEEPPPEEEPEKEEVEEEPVIQDLEVTEDIVEETEVEEFEISDTKESAFDSNAWNSAVGLGGGAGGKFGGRGGGRGGLKGKSGKATAIAIELGLKWLKDHQDENGGWDCDGFMKHDVEGTPCDGAGASVHDIGVTGLALLAFLGDGSTMRSGPYKDVIKKGVDWLREQQDPDTGLFGRPNSNEFIYNHAIASLAMIEAVGLSQSRFTRKYAQRAIEYLEYHRNPYSVWRYQPRDGDNDTSVTGWAVMAYKSAQDFKFDVNEQALDYAKNWFDSMTDDKGRTGYIERGGPSSRKVGDHAVEFPREKGECMTAVALLCRFFLGQNPKDYPVMKQHADLILDKLPTWEQDGSIDHYYWYYGSYALFQYGEDAWDKWRKSLDSAVVKTQRQDGNFKGSWDPIGVWGHDGGRVYSTATLVLTLEAYYRYTRLIR